MKFSRSSSGSEWQGYAKPWGYTQGVQKGRGKVTVIHTLVIPPPMSRVCSGTQGYNPISHIGWHRFTRWVKCSYGDVCHLCDLTI